MTKRYKPLVDRLFWFIWVPTLILMAAATVISAFDSLACFIMIPADAFVLYFLISPLFGYVELREDTVFIKYGFFINREIPYGKIRDAYKKKSFIAETMLSLKNAIEHIEIKYNSYDVTAVSVVGNDDLLAEIKARIK